MESTKDIEQRNLVSIFTFIRENNVSSYGVFVAYCLDNMEIRFEWFDLAVCNPVSSYAIVSFFNTFSGEETAKVELAALSAKTESVHPMGCKPDLSESSMFPSFGSVSTTISETLARKINDEEAEEEERLRRISMAFVRA